MSKQPAVILLADAQPARQISLPVDDWYSPTATLIRRVQAINHALVLVAPAALHEAVSSLLPMEQRVVVEAPGLVMQRHDWLVRGMAAGVMACAQACGWMFLPVDMPMVLPETLREMGGAIAQHPLAYPSYQHRRGQPVCFSAEMYSELIQLSTEHDLRRLVARYPATDVDVQDPGIHMRVGDHQALDHWRSQLGSGLDMSGWQPFSAARQMLV
jgi:molybdenum cofactor cytidylyltransferase